MLAQARVPIPYTHVIVHHVHLEAAAQRRRAAGDGALVRELVERAVRNVAAVEHNRHLVRVRAAARRRLDLLREVLSLRQARARAARGGEHGAKLVVRPVDGGAARAHARREHARRHQVVHVRRRRRDRARHHRRRVVRRREAHAAVGRVEHEVAAAHRAREIVADRRRHAHVDALERRGDHNGTDF